MMTDLAIFLQREKDRLQAELEAVKRERALAVREIGVKTDLLHKSVKESSGLRKELEAVRKLLGQWLDGEEFVGCKCRLCNDTRKLLKGR